MHGRFLEYMASRFEFQYELSWRLCNRSIRGRRGELYEDKLLEVGAGGWRAGAWNSDRNERPGAMRVAHEAGEADELAFAIGASAPTADGVGRSGRPGRRRRVDRWNVARDVHSPDHGRITNSQYGNRQRSRRVA
jgi:hypothetical protein